MPNIQLIIATIDKYLEQHRKEYLTAVEAAAILDRKGILKDSTTRRGLPLRNLLRADALPYAFQVGVYWRIPHSGKDWKPKVAEIEENHQNEAASNSKHKLYPIAKSIAEYLENKFKKPANFIMEHSPEWLKSVPEKEVLEKYWPLVKNVYASLVDNKYDLDEQLKLVIKPGKQYFDIWFDDPYCFAVEFDEEQHFNQFRRRTLDFYGDFDCGINLGEYKQYCNIEKKPGTSGFQKLSKADPLFPPILEGDKQDNRIRQRAFKDFLKDIVPVAKDFCPTVRIPFQLVGNKIKDFDQQDLQRIVEYIKKNDFVN